MKKRGIILLSLLACVTISSYGQSHAPSALDSLQQQEERPAMIFLHTDWCRYCQAMKKTTFRDTTLTRRLHQEVWWADFNAEERERVWFNGQPYDYLPSGPGTGVHALATHLAGEKLTFPLLIVLDSQHQVIGRFPGFLSVRDVNEILDALTPPSR